MAKRLREQYLRAILRQDIAFFDNVGAGEVATRIQTDTRKSTFLLNFLLNFHVLTPLLDLVQQGTSEKVARESSPLKHNFHEIAYI
jgi:ABC-type multidrug transport system fused ATPase/permease subunit